MPAIKSHTTATVDTSWDGPLQKKNTLSGKDLAYYSKIYAWRDPEGDETVKATYKFVHHEVSADGTPGAANTVGCSTGTGVLNGGMGGTTIPDADRQGVYDHLAKHIQDAGKEAPPLNKIGEKIMAMMPHPNEGEGEGQFMVRCLNDPSMMKECPDDNQRHDVCEALWVEPDMPGGPGMGDRLLAKGNRTIGDRASFRGYEIRALANQEAEIWIYDEIGQGWFVDGITAKQFGEELRGLGKVNKITVRLNSPGGDVFDGFAIYNLLKQHPANIEMWIDGIAASIASVIAMAGDKIYMAGNASMFIHRTWGGVMGNAEDMRDVANKLDKLDGSITGTYAKRTGMDWQKIKDLMDAETIMSSHEAFEMGFVDQIMDELQLAAHFDMSKFNFKKNPPAAGMPMQPQAAETDKGEPMPPDLSVFDEAIKKCQSLLTRVQR